MRCDITIKLVKCLMVKLCCLRYAVMFAYEEKEFFSIAERKRKKD